MTQNWAFDWRGRQSPRRGQRKPTMHCALRVDASYVITAFRVQSLRLPLPSARRVTNWLAGNGRNSIKRWDATSLQALDLMGEELWTRRIAYDPKGKWVATAEDDYSIRLWRTDTGRQQDPLTGHSATNYRPGVQFRWRHIGPRPAKDGSARLWDVASGQLPITLPISSKVLGVAFNPAGNQLALVSVDGILRLSDWKDKTDYDSGTLLR